MPPTPNETKQALTPALSRSTGRGGNAGNAFNLARLRPALKPFRLHWFPRLRSTNDHAIAMRKRGELFAPAVVLTGHQLAGRGRGSNTWWSGPGTLTVTFALPVEDRLAPYQVPLIAGLAARAATAEVVGDDAIQLKWPNDLLHRGRKLAGLLCERVDKADLIGLGLNVNVEPSRAPKSLRERITSLSDIAGRPIDVTNALATIAQHVHRLLARRDELSFTQLLREYDRHHALIGKRVTVIGTGDNGPVSGRCDGLDGNGRLLLRHRGKLNRVIAGQVQLLEN